MTPLRGDQLIEDIRRGSGDMDAAANDLVAEFGEGYPIENLRKLLRSDDASVLKIGAWIASELGRGAVSMLDDIAGLLEHPVAFVRFFSVDAVLVNASVNDGPIIAQAVRLINDSDVGVRWKSMQFLSRATSAQLRAAMRHLQGNELVGQVGWLLDSEAGSASDVAARLHEEQLVTRLFAAAAAARHKDSRQALLARAAASSDPEVSSFALGELKVQEARDRELE